MHAMIPESRDYEGHSRSLNIKMHNIIYIFQQPYKVDSFIIISFWRPLCYPEEAGITSIFDIKSWYINQGLKTTSVLLLHETTAI